MRSPLSKIKALRADNRMFTMTRYPGGMRGACPLFLWSLAGSIAVMAAPAPAAAQCLLCSQPAPSPDRAAGSGESDGGTADQPLRIEITANLDFSRIAGGNGGGSIGIDPTGRGSVQGDVAAIGGTGFSGHVVVTGTPGRTISITMPREAELTSSSGRIARLRNIVAGVPPVARLGPDGRLEFGFGGVLDVGRDATGDYSGRIPITVSYE